jgi:hypothetical protein
LADDGVLTSTACLSKRLSGLSENPEADLASIRRHDPACLGVGDHDAPVRKFLSVKPLGHPRVPFAGFRPDHHARTELAAIDAHRAAEAAADIER